MAKKLLIFDLIDEAYCYEKLRELKWKKGLECMDCRSKNIRRNGHDKGIEHRQRYVCKDCNKSFTDISNTVIASNHVSIQKWMVCAALKDFMSNKQMAKALELSEKVVGDMRAELSEGFIKNASLNDWAW